MFLTVTFPATAAVSIITVAPGAIVTLSRDNGTAPFAHVEGELHRPPAAVEGTLLGGSVVGEKFRGGLTTLSDIAFTI